MVNLYVSIALVALAVAVCVDVLNSNLCFTLVALAVAVGVNVLVALTADEIADDGDVLKTSENAFKRISDAGAYAGDLLDSVTGGERENEGYYERQNG